MKKVSTVSAKQGKNFSQLTLTIGLDLGDRNSCVEDESGQIQLEQGVRTNAKALCEVFGAMPGSRIAMETGTHSPRISRLRVGTRSECGECAHFSPAKARVFIGLERHG